MSDTKITAIDGGNMEYTVVGTHKAGLLLQAVNSLIAKGWRPQGGVAVLEPRDQQSHDGAKMMYFQAMVRGKQ